MSDDTTEFKIADAEAKVNPPVVAQEPPTAISFEPGTPPEGFAPASEPTSAVDRLRAFEDEKLGEDAPRFAGKIERGYGSLFGRLSPENQKTHAALEKLVVAEQKLADAHGALLAAEDEHQAALAAVGG